MKLYGEVEVKDITKIVIDREFVYERCCSHGLIWWVCDRAAYSPDHVMEHVNSYLSKHILIHVENKKFVKFFCYAYHAWISEHTLNVSMNRDLESFLQKKRRDEIVTDLLDKSCEKVHNNLVKQMETNPDAIEALYGDCT
jgi:hypothetical protein